MAFYLLAQFGGKILKKGNVLAISLILSSFPNNDKFI